MVHCATSLAETLIGVTSGGWLSCSASERITRSRATPLGVACLMRVGIAPSGTVSAAYRCSKSSHTSNKHATWRQVLHTQETANPVSPAAKTDAWEVGSVPAPPSHRPDPTLPSGARGRVREGRQGAAQLRGGCAAQQVGHSAHRLWCGTLLDSQCTVQALPVTAPTSVTALHSLFAPTPETNLVCSRVCWEAESRLRVMVPKRASWLTMTTLTLTQPLRGTELVLCCSNPVTCNTITPWTQCVHVCTLPQPAASHSCFNRNHTGHSATH